MINVLVNSDPRYKVDRELIRRAVEEVLGQQKVTGRVEVGVSLVGDRKMEELNKQFCKLDETTDVLSFPLENDATKLGSKGFAKFPDKILRLGDVIVSYPQALKQAAENNILVEEEIKSLVQHGVLHLLGIHHEE